MLFELFFFFFFFFKQKTAYEIRPCDWSSDVCSSDLRWGLRSFAGYPVLVGDELLAVMALANTEPLRFGADTQDLIDMFLAQAAIAIQNARAYREAQRRRDVAEVLARLARELTATLEVEPIAKLLARGAAELVNARAAGVYLVEPEDGSLRALAAYGADADIMRELVFKPGEG